MRCLIRWLPLLLLLSLASLVRGAEPTATEAPLFTFLVSSDPHTGEDKAGQPTGREKLRQLLLQSQQQTPQPDFLVITGDLQVPAFREVLEQVRPSLPLHVVAGNHERGEDREALRAMFPDDFRGADFYSFKHKECLFIALCDAAATDHIGHFNSQSIRGPEQGAWLQRLLSEEAKTAKRTFVFGHIPPHLEGQFGGMHLGVNDQKFLRELVLEHPPTAMFFGHLHKRVDFQIGATPVFGLPSSNWNFDQSSLGYLEVQVFADRLATQWIPLRLP